MNIFQLLIILTGIIPYILLSVGIIYGTIRQSFASWVLWLALDIIVLVGLVGRDGNILLFSVFAFGTLIVALLLGATNQFSWGKFETSIAVLVSFCAMVLLLSGQYWAIIITTVALNIAGVPQLVETFKYPKSTPTLPYILLGVSSFLSVWGAQGWTVEQRLPQMSSMIYCFIVVALSLRPQSIQKA